MLRFYQPCLECQKRIKVGADRYEFKGSHPYVFCSMECMREQDQRSIALAIDHYKHLDDSSDEEAGPKGVAWNQMRAATSAREFSAALERTN